MFGFSRSNDMGNTIKYGMNRQVPPYALSVFVSDVIKFTGFQRYLAVIDQNKSGSFTLSGIDRIVGLQ